VVEVTIIPAGTTFFTEGKVVMMVNSAMLSDVRRLATKFREAVLRRTSRRKRVVTRRSPSRCCSSARARVESGV